LESALQNPSSVLSQYQSLQLNILSQLNLLLSLTKDNPTQQSKIKILQIKLDNYFQELDKLILKQQNSNETNNTQIINRYTSNFKINEQLKAIEEHEKNLLDIRRATAARQGNIVTATVIVSLLLAGILSWQTNKERERQLAKENRLNTQLRLNEIEQDLNNHLLACRSKEEAYEILHSFFQYLLPNSSGAICEINNSRDQLQPTVVMGDFDITEICTPKDCWALRQGQTRSGERKIFAIPCQLCKKIYSDGTPQTMICAPLQAHEQTIGILHLTDTETADRDFLTNLSRQIALPLAILHLQAELEHQTFRDSATGLWNRRFMDASVQRIFARAKRLSYDSESQYLVGVIFCDVDHFKTYNTEFGHEAGDMVLRSVAKFLIESCREDDLPCRYGGEEFVLILPDTDLKGTQIKAERIREGVKRLPAPGNRTISLSLGVAIYPWHGATPEEVLKAANLAMLRAKAEGRDRTLTAT
jgi:diguanylate cyclase (GGDEF)-like protein